MNSKKLKEFDEKEWEEIQKEIKEIDKKGGRANTIGVNIITGMTYVMPVIPPVIPDEKCAGCDTIFLKKAKQPFTIKDCERIPVDCKYHRINKLCPKCWSNEEIWEKTKD